MRVYRTRVAAPGVPPRCQALPGAEAGILKQEIQGSCPQGGTVCVCARARMCGMYVLCVWCENAGNVVVCPMIRECS